METRTRNLIAAFAIAGGLALGAYALFSKKSDEELIRERLDQLARVASVDDPDENPLFRASRLQKAFAEIFTPNVRIEASELESFSGTRDELVPLATRASNRFQHAEVTIKSPKIDLIAGGQAAKVAADAELSSEENGEPHRDERRVAFGLTKTRDGWQIDSVVVTPKME